MNIKDLQFDKKNYNKGTEQGDKLLDKSIRKFGYRQPAVVDKNGNIVAGNKRIAKAGELGIDEVNIVKGDPNKITVIQFDDFDLENDKLTKEYALADNQVAKVNIEIDTDVVVDDLGEGIVEEWGVEITNYIASEDREIDLTNEQSKGFVSFVFPHQQYLQVLDLLNNAKGKLQCDTNEDALLEMLKPYE